MQCRRSDGCSIAATDERRAEINRALRSEVQTKAHAAEVHTQVAEDAYRRVPPITDRFKQRGEVE